MLLAVFLLCSFLVFRDIFKPSDEEKECSKSKNNIKL